MGDTIRLKCSAVLRKKRSRHLSSGWAGIFDESDGRISSKKSSDRSGYWARISMAVKLTKTYCDELLYPALAVINARCRRDLRDLEAIKGLPVQGEKSKLPDYQLISLNAYLLLSAARIGSLSTLPRIARRTMIKEKRGIFSNFQSVGIVVCNETVSRNSDSSD